MGRWHDGGREELSNFAQKLCQTSFEAPRSRKPCMFVAFRSLLYKMGRRQGGTLKLRTETPKGSFRISPGSKNLVVSLLSIIFRRNFKTRHRNPTRFLLNLPCPQNHIFFFHRFSTKMRRWQGRVAQVLFLVSLGAPRGDPQRPWNLNVAPQAFQINTSQ